MRKIDEFAKLFASRDSWTVARNQETFERNKDHYANFFRQYVNDEWCAAGFDTFETKEECEKWANKYLREYGNREEEILPNIKVSAMIRAIAGIELPRGSK